MIEEWTLKGNFQVLPRNFALATKDYLNSFNVKCFIRHAVYLCIRYARYDTDRQATKLS